MKYMLMIYANTGSDIEPTCDFEDWQRYSKELEAAGVHVSGHALEDLVTATSVQVDANGRRSITDQSSITEVPSITDGPFAESREVLGGYDVIDVPNLDVALDWAARCPGSRDGGRVVVRPIADFGE